MRVLFLSTEFPPGPGGIGTHAYQLASGLTERGWDVAVLSSQDYVSDAAIAAFNAGQPFPIERLESIGGAPRRLYARARRVLEFAREWKPDLIVASGDRATWLGAWLSGRVRVPW